MFIAVLRKQADEERGRPLTRENVISFLSSLSVPVLTVSMSFAPTWSGAAGQASIQDQRDRWEKKRNLTAVEVLQTERRYCEQLELVTTVGPATTSAITVGRECL